MSAERFLFLILLQQISINCQLRLEYNCWNYRVRNEELAYQNLFHINEETIPYCFRPIDQNESIHFNFTDNIHRNLTFEELRLENITTEDLLLWSTSIDIIEDYQYYLNEYNSSYSKLRYSNCTKPWFGIHCEYSFEYFSMNEIVQREFSRKTFSVSIPCYVHLECDRGGSSLCLDWREICDGHIDCLNNGIDEFNCMEMEMNECNDDEYRCHNGLCIPEEYSNDGVNQGDCLDRSDEIPDVLYVNNCIEDPRFRCEEHSCRSNWHEFSCGDGQCVQKFDQCANGRHLLLRRSLTVQKDLDKSCWIMMVCLTKLLDEIDGKSCEDWLNEDLVVEYLQTCEEPLIEFPRIPIHRDHIRFLYNKSSLKFPGNSFIYPDYICYDEQLCDCLQSTFIYKNLTCVSRSVVQLELSISGHPWIDIIHQLNSYFSSCLITRLSIDNSSSLYSCANSSKFISKSRIADETKDCYFGDDENTSLSCSLNDKHRIQCPDINLCLSPINSLEDCPDFIDRYSPRIPFENYCDGIEEYSYKDPTGHLYTDESHCDHWPCNNLYSRCDGLWKCSNGEDEENCDENLCPFGTHPCVTFGNYSLICLEKERVGDEVIDCLGASDEPYFCRELYPLKRDYERFRCLESDLCLSRWDLCDRIESCPLGEDEQFCSNYPLDCQGNESLIERILCQSSELNHNRKIHFSLQTSIIYPRTPSSPVHWSIPPMESKEMSIESRMTNPLNWNCHRGLPIRIWSADETIQYGCLCPPSYYGQFCEYQSERISITLGIIRARKDEIYTIILMLLDENDSKQLIDSFDQFDYKSIESCSIKFHRYLLYPTRPKNISKTYHLRIDIYEKRTLTYHSSWDYSIPFLFLPVNRLIIRLDLSSSSSRCSSMKCNHGECVKYVNKAKEFCRCFPGWSGVECHIPIDCQSCSVDSICIGRINDHSICLCPLMKFGRRCLLSSTCPANACENNGLCIPEDWTIGRNDYQCLCPEGFFGSKCQFIQSRLDVSIDDLDIPGYLIAFFLTISGESKPRSTILIEKLTLFQRVVTFHLSIEYHLVIIKSNERFYLAVVQPIAQLTLSTSINPTRECLSIKTLFNSTILNFPQFERMKYVHLLCQHNRQLICFLDEDYFCLCTDDHQANCVDFARAKNFSCLSKDFCANGGECFEDHPQCPSSRICVCEKCFFGNQCQFYAKGFGLTLDQLLAYEIQRNLGFFQQNFPVKLTGGMTMLMFIIGLINGICSILTFRNKISQEVGCGMYLLASSITSLLIVIFFTMKFWFLLLSYSDWFGQEFLRYFNCIVIEPLLKILLYTDNWYNGCIAIERAFAVFKGIYFNKNRSKFVARWMIWMILLGNVMLLIPQWLFLQLFHDEKEGRMWCVVLYSSKLDFYHSVLMIGHFFIPFFLNFSSAIFIIIETARQRVATQKKQIYSKEFENKLKQHKHLLLSPIILILLSLPRLIITFQLNCQKSFEHFWLYLFGYFVSFIPAVLVFVIFVLPSVVFKKAFKQAILRIRRRLSLFKMKFYFNKHL